MARNTGKPWTPSDIQTLITLATINTPTPTIAQRLQRTEDAVYAKASDEGISLKPKDRPR